MGEGWSGSDVNISIMTLYWVEGILKKISDWSFFLSFDLQPEELKEAVLQSVHSRAKENQVEPTQNEERRVMSLKEKVESIAYEDWAVDMKDVSAEILNEGEKMINSWVLLFFCLQLSLGTKLGSGSSGRLYRGIYRGQDVAVKVIRLWESTNGAGGPEDLSGTLRAQPASELLQLFQQEVSIMR